MTPRESAAKLVEEARTWPTDGLAATASNIIGRLASALTASIAREAAAEERASEWEKVAQSNTEAGNALLALQNDLAESQKNSGFWGRATSRATSRANKLEADLAAAREEIARLKAQEQGTLDAANKLAIQHGSDMAGIRENVKRLYAQRDAALRLASERLTLGDAIWRSARHKSTCGGPVGEACGCGLHVAKMAWKDAYGHPGDRRAMEAK